MIELLKNWPKGESVPALSLRHPWAGAVAYFGKDVENRSRNFKYRGPLIIHASATQAHIDDCNLFLQLAEVGGAPEQDLLQMKAALARNECPDWFYVGIVAVANLSDVVKNGDPLPDKHPVKDSPWRSDESAYWLYLEDVVPVSPVEFKGAVGMFRVPYEIAASLEPLSLAP